MSKDTGKNNSASCPIVYDLLPLYIDGACSEESKRLVEEHLAGCAACKRKLEAMAGEPGIPPAGEEFVAPMLPEDAARQNRDRAARRIIRRIKRRWLVSLLACLLLVPLAWLSVNEYSGNGIAYTNMYDYYRVGKFGSALEQGDYEQAFSYLDIAFYYNAIQQDKEYARTATVDRADFQLVIYEDGRQEYTNGQFSVPAEDFEQWLRDAEQGLADLQAYYNASPYADMTYDQFYQESKRNFIANMQQWARLGYSFQGAGVGYSYDHYSYAYRFHLSNGNNTWKSGTLTMSGKGKGKFYISGASYTPGESAVADFTSYLMIWPRAEGKEE